MSSYTRPDMLPSGLVHLNASRRSTALLLATGLYCVRPLQVDVHAIPGRTKSPKPVSKLTVKVCVGLPAVMSPCQSEPLFSSVSSSEAYARSAFERRPNDGLKGGLDPTFWS